jgi:type II secretory pathway component PulM
MKQLKAYWNDELNDSQRKLSLVAIVLFVAIMFYNFVWEPLHSGVHQLRKDYVANQELLTWMKQAQVQLKQKNKTKKIVKGKNQSLLALSEQSVKNSRIDSSVKEIKQANDNTVQIRFENIAYAAIIQWVDALGREYGMGVDKLTIRQTDTPGVVKADVIVSR